MTILKPTYEALEKENHALKKEVAKRDRVDQAFHLEESRLEALLKLNEMTGARLQDITDFALEEAVRLTGSKIGYLAFMNDDETVLTMHSWSKSAMALCAIRNKPKVYPIETTGLWGEAVRQRRAVITNHYAEPSSLKKGYPKGHVEIRRHVCVPVFDGSKIVVVAGMGNKEKEYNQTDVRQLKLLIQGMWRLILRKWTEWELRESEDKFRRLVETVGCAIFIYQGTRISFANPASETIFGYKPEELVSKNFWEILHPENRALARERGLARQRGEAVPPRYEVKIQRKNGEVGWCDFTLSSIEFEGRSAVLGIALDITERKRSEAALEESERKFRELSSYLLNAQENERKRISFELHDELGQSLSVLKLKLRSVEKELGEDRVKLRSDRVNVFQDIDYIIENIRRLTHDLSPALLEDLGLFEALRWMVNEFARHNNNRVIFSIEDIDYLFSQEAQIIIYRVFQEALTNIGKHAGAKQISMKVKAQKESVIFVMEDDGSGFDMDAPLPRNPNEKGFGLAAMEERARMLGASLHVLSRPDHGTSISSGGPNSESQGKRMKVTEPYRIVLADDHKMFRLGVRKIIDETDDLAVVGEAGDGLELLELIKTLSPQMVILDISMPKMRGVEATREIKMIDPGIKILVLTMHRNKELLYHCFSEGAKGYLLKEDTDTELFSAIDAIRKGRSYVSPILSIDLADDLSRIYSGSQNRSQERLTLREREVLTLISEGKSRKEIADALYISVHTVGHHRSNILRKLNIRKTAELVKYAVRKGYTSTNS